MTLYDTPTVKDIKLTREEIEKIKNETPEEKEKRLKAFLEEFNYTEIY